MKTVRLSLKPADRKRGAYGKKKRQSCVPHSLITTSLLTQEMYEEKVSKIGIRIWSNTYLFDYYFANFFNQSKVAELEFKMPNETNKQSILLLMDETRNNRQDWIKGSSTESLPPSLDEILRKFPKFKDFNGELVIRFILTNF